MMTDAWLTHACHPIQLGSKVIDTPLQFRATFEVMLPARAHRDDVIQFGGVDFRVLSVLFDEDCCIHCRVEYDGPSQRPAPYYEAQYGREPTHA